MQKNDTSLSVHERQVIKALLNDGMRNQDIQALINTGRKATINSGRISGIKKDNTIIPATPPEVATFKKMKESFDPLTGLNPFLDERLIRAREAMKLAVMLYNSPGYCFKTETFSVLANIAWTYLLHQHRLNENLDIQTNDGTTMSLSYMLKQPECHLSEGIKNNLNALKGIRDEVEHKLMGSADTMFLPIYQACCLNFEKTIVSWFGPRMSLTSDLSVALQFSKMDINQASQLMQYDVPDNIKSLDANLINGMSENALNDIEYQFRVIYTLDSASKTNSHMQFVHPSTAEGKEIHNVLQKVKLADDLYPYKPKKVIELVKKGALKPFTSNDHTKAWKRHKVRKKAGQKGMENTNKEYCIYHPAHNDFTYSQAWVDLLINELNA